MKISVSFKHLSDSSKNDSLLFDDEMISVNNTHTSKNHQEELPSLNDDLISSKHILNENGRASLSVDDLLNSDTGLIQSSSKF